MEKAFRSASAASVWSVGRSSVATTVRDGIYRLAALAALVVLTPVLLAAAVAVLLEDGWPVLYRQQRVGQHNRLFSLLKFRSMRRNDGSGPAITAASDPRVTRCGAILRKYKLDELPQLWNVVRGDMSLVGSRPEVPRYVAYEDKRWQAVLAERPGLTDLATLVYRNEEDVLASAPDPEKYYREVLLPDKLNLNLHYQRGRTIGSDLRLILATIRYSVAPAGFDAAKVRRMLSEDLGR